MMKKKYSRHLLIGLSAFFSAFAVNAAQKNADIVVYGGTSAGVVSAVAAANEGKSVIIVCPDKHLGAMSSSGLGFTDSGKTYTIGGLSKEFYRRIWKEYQKPETWKFGFSKDTYKAKGQGTVAIDDKSRCMWVFEPRVAEKVYNDWLAEKNVPVFKGEYLDRKSGVVKKDGKIVEIKTLSGNSYTGKVFIDATFEGDLMATAGCDYRVGREANSEYGEKHNGVQVGVLHHDHYFAAKVDPYKEKGNPKSGLLKHISAEPAGEYGQADKKIQAYCYRMCTTNVPENRIPWPKPDNYNTDDYLLWLRNFEADPRTDVYKPDPIPNGKTDTNNQSAFSTDFIGGNYNYPEASYEEREKILKAHTDYQLGLMYFLANDPRVPEVVRKKTNEFALPKDEFTDTNHWPFNIYVREARRLVGEYVMTEHDCRDCRDTPKSIGMGSYTVDSHNVQRYITKSGHVQNEGDIGVGASPYKISYGAITPKKSQCKNLLVPVACSATHIAYGSIRMEPVFMILGHSAAVAASIAIDENCTVQDVDYAKLSAKLLKQGQILKYKKPQPKQRGVRLSKEQAKAWREKYCEK